MPKTKPIKPSAFIMFVLERKRELEQDGQQFTGLAEAVEKLGHEWKMMSKDARAPFEQKAKEKKAELLKRQLKGRTQTNVPVYGFGVPD